MRERAMSFERHRWRPSGGPGSWLATHSVELVFAAIIGAAFVHLLRVTDDAYFFGDDWGLILKGGRSEGCWSRTTII